MIGRRPNSIVDVVFDRSASDGLAYVFLADGTSASEVRWTFADTATESPARSPHTCGIEASAPETASCWP